MIYPAHQKSSHSLRLRRLRLTHLFHHISDPQLVNVNLYRMCILLLILTLTLVKPAFAAMAAAEPLRVLV